MDKLKEKFSSRKFWAAVVAWLTSILAAFNVSDSAAAQATVIVSGIGALLVYILAEAKVDASRKDAQTGGNDGE